MQTYARAVGTPAAVITSLANALEPSSWAAAPDGPKHGDALGAYRVGDPGDQRRLGPDHHQVAAVSTASAATAAGSVAVDRPQLSHRGDPRVTRRRNQRGNGRIRHQPERERMLPPTTTHQKNPHARDPTVPHPTPADRR